jgi:hypothetical protein
MAKTSLKLMPGNVRWYDRWSRYLAFLALLATLLTTTIVFFTTGKELGGMGALVTACIGLLGLAISLQIETIFRVAERAETREKYGRMLELIEDHPDLQPFLADALQASVTTLKRSRVEEFRREVFSILMHADVRLQELAQGRLRTADGDNTLVFSRFAMTNGLLCGTTDEGDTAWWRTDAGNQFLGLNKQLIADRDVRIERVWILGVKPDPTTGELIQEHHEAGIHVYVLRADRPGLDRRLLVNLTLMDDVFLQEDLPNKVGQAVEYLYSENIADLERAKSRFAQLKSAASEYKDPESLAALFENSQGS